MKIYRKIEITNKDSYVKTFGLKAAIGNEIKVIIKRRSIEEYIRVMKYLIDYVLTTNPLIVPEQTIGYYSWILKFVAGDQGNLILYEADALGEGYIEGVDYSVKVLNEQESECAKFNVSCMFPFFSQNIAISKGVYEGLAIEAVHMSGWWLTTDLFDDDTNSLMNVHFFHVAFKRPEILRFLALPFGYRFLFSKNIENIWYDEKVLE
jgi:hypothetical protein